VQLLNQPRLRATVRRRSELSESQLPPERWARGGCHRRSYRCTGRLVRCL